MAGGVRTTIGRRSREADSTVGVQINTFGLDKLAEGINGQDLLDILLEAAEPSRVEAYNNWAYLTGASRDSIELVPVEAGERLARIVLQVGGDKLRNDPRNHSHKDYAPYLEFNGSPSGKTPAGVLRNSIYDNDREIRERIQEGLKRKIEEKLR